MTLRSRKCHHTMCPECVVYAWVHESVHSIVYFVFKYINDSDQHQSSFTYLIVRLVGFGVVWWCIHLIFSSPPAFYLSFRCVIFLCLVRQHTRYMFKISTPAFHSLHASVVAVAIALIFLNTLHLLLFFAAAVAVIICQRHIHCFCSNSDCGFNRFLYSEYDVRV